MAARIDSNEVRRIAALARLGLADDEIEYLTRDLTVILDWFAQVSRANTADVPPTTHPLPVRDVLRDDEPGQPLSAGQALANAPERKNHYFSVPRVLGRE